MTLVAPDQRDVASDASPSAPPAVAAEPGAAPEGVADVGPGEASPPTPGAIAATAGAWLVLLLLAVVAVLYPLGPLFQRREQHRLLSGFRVKVQQAADAKQGLAGVLNAKKPVAPVVGDPVAILDLGGGLRIQQVALEGVGPDQTRRGPGHVPGTAGLGQPGNSVVVGRRTGWGAPLARLGKLGEGDKIVATTTQGQSVYAVQSVKRQTLKPTSLYGPSNDDRLTLVTSASRSPFARSEALVVRAKLQGQPFEPTPQGGRTSVADGRHGDRSAVPLLVLFGLGYVVAAALAGLLYRRWRPLTAYLLTTPALVVFAILAGEAGTRLFPAWT